MNYTNTCSVCGKEIIGLGNDPRPIVDDKAAWCCDECDSHYVQPAKRMLNYLEKFSKANEVVIKFDGLYLGIKRRFQCWEYWIANDNADYIDEGVYEDSSAPMTTVIKNLMLKFNIVPTDYELLEPDPYYMIEYLYE